MRKHFPSGFGRVLKFRLGIGDADPSVLTAQFETDGAQALVRRLGRSVADWAEG